MFIAVFGRVESPRSAAAMAATQLVRLGVGTVVIKSYAEALVDFAKRNEGKVSLIVIDAEGPSSAVQALSQLREKWSQQQLPAIVMKPGTWEPGDKAVVANPYDANGFERAVRALCQR